MDMWPLSGHCLYASRSRPAGFKLPIGLEERREARNGGDPAVLHDATKGAGEGWHRGGHSGPAGGCPVIIWRPDRVRIGRDHACAPPPIPHRVGVRGPLRGGYGLGLAISGSLTISDEATFRSTPGYPQVPFFARIPSRQVGRVAEVPGESRRFLLLLRPRPGERALANPPGPGGRVGFIHCASQRTIKRCRLIRQPELFGNNVERLDRDRDRARGGKVSCGRAGAQNRRPKTPEESSRGGASQPTCSGLLRVEASRSSGRGRFDPADGRPAHYPRGYRPPLLGPGLLSRATAALLPLLADHFHLSRSRRQ